MSTILFIPSHDDFWSNDVTYYNGDIETHVVREKLTPPSFTAVKAPYTSLEAMLRANGTKLVDTAYSHLPRAPFTGTVKRGRESFSVRNQYFYERCPLNGQQYTGKDGKVHEVYQAVTSSWDRSSEGLHMAKVVVDPKTRESVCYGSRPDTAKRALAQAEDIFKTEKASLKKGLVINKKTGVYTLTYVVDSLTNPVKIQNPFMLNERESLITEYQALQDLRKKEVVIDGFRVKLNPIHVHHTLSVFGELAKLLPDSLSGKEIEVNINRAGHGELIKYANHLASKETVPKKKQLILDTVFQLQHEKLTVSERLIVVDFLTRLCNLPIVHHCKSIVDRTSVASSVAMMNHFIKDGKLIKTIPKNQGKFAIHKLLDDPEYKKFFISFMNINHQVSRDARLGILPGGDLLGRSALGLNLKSGLLSATGALPFFPDEDKKKTLLSQGRVTRTFVIGTFYLLLIPLIFFYYIGLVFATPILLHKLMIKKVSGKKDFFKILYTLPLRIKWRSIKDLNMDQAFDLKSENINGDGKHLLCAAKHIRDKEMPDPRLDLIPDGIL